MTRSLTSLLILSIASLLALACGEQSEIEAGTSAPPVMLVEVMGSHVLDRIEATGQLLAKDQAQVAAQVDGQVTGVEVEEGAAVAQGEVIVQIDPELRQLEVDRTRAEIAQARAEVSEAKREAERIKNLRERNAVSESQLDTALTNERLALSRLEATRARLGIAERALRDSQVEAPFSGFVARRHVSRGEYVRSGQILFDLVALDPIEIEFHLAEIDSSRAMLDAPVTLRVVPYPGEAFPARVTAISPTIDSETRTLRVKAELPNPDGRLRPGLFARIDLGLSERENVPMVPEEVVLQRADGSVVFRMSGPTTVERINVQTGIYRDGNVEIVSGLEPGQRVVIRGQTELIDGSTVSVRNQDGTPAGPGAVGAASSSAAVGRGS